MDKIFASLLESPLFNLSLSSKELFHSNFLYWIGKNYPEETGDFFSKFCSIEPDNKRIVLVKREKDNIDFSFSYTNGQKVLIENKVKSIAHISQLEKYTKTIDEKICHILLSLSRPSFGITDDNTFIVKDVRWFYLSYFEYNKFIIKLSEKLKNDYHKNILKDYSNFILGLTEIEKISNLKHSDKFDFHSFDSDKIYNSLIDLRFHDYYLKKKYESLSNLIYLKTKESDLPVLNFGAEPNWGTNNEEITFGFGMTNAQGLSDTKYKIAHNVILGIQIQGESFRLFIEDKDGQIAHKIKDQLFAKKLWFYFDNFGEVEIYPKGTKEFNKYGNVFYYKSIKLGTKYSIDEIVNIIVDYLKTIKINSLQIKDLIINAS